MNEKQAKLLLERYRKVLAWIVDKLQKQEKTELVEEILAMQRLVDSDKHEGE
jgi:hypothetical protein